MRWIKLKIFEVGCNMADIMESALYKTNTLLDKYEDLWFCESLDESDYPNYTQPSAQITHEDGDIK